MSEKPKCPRDFWTSHGDHYMYQGQEDRWFCSACEREEEKEATAKLEARIEELEAEVASNDQRLADLFDKYKAAETEVERLRVKLHTAKDLKAMAEDEIERLQNVLGIVRSVQGGITLPVEYKLADRINQAWERLEKWRETDSMEEAIEAVCDAQAILRPSKESR